VTVGVVINFPNVTLVATANPVLLGPLGDLFAIMHIPGQEAQFFTDLMPPSILRQVSQNFTNVLNTLSIPAFRRPYAAVDRGRRTQRLLSGTRWSSPTRQWVPLSRH